MYLKKFSFGSVSETMSGKRMKAIFGGYVTGYWKVNCIVGNKVIPNCFSIAEFASCLDAYDATSCEGELGSCVAVYSCE